MTPTSSIIRHGNFWLCLPLGLAVTIPNAGLAADSNGNYRVSFSLGAAFNISAKFSGHPGALNLQSSQSQAGAANFDNGFVGADVSGDPNLTTFWGYSRVNQPVADGNGNVIGLNYERTTVAADSMSPKIDADPSLAGEILLRRSISTSGGRTIGVELGVSYMSLSLHDDSAYTVDGQRTGYSFALPSPVNAELFPPPGYQGPFNGLGLNLNQSQTTGQTVAAPAAIAVSGSRRIDADVFGFRLGPYWEIQFDETLAASFSAGAVVAFINDSVTWSESISVNTATDNGYWTGQSSASGSRSGVAYGYYVGADVNWSLNERWSVVGGCRVQDLGTYTHGIGLGQMQLSLRRSIFVSLGVGYSF